MAVQEIQKERVDVTLLMNSEWYSAMIYLGYISSRTLWIKFQFTRVKISVVVVYGPTEGGKSKKGRDSGMN